MFFYSKNAAGESTGAEQLWIPYAFIGCVVIVLAIVFFFANVPDIKMEDDYHLDDDAHKLSHSIWSRPHFYMAVAAQFLYVAAQAGIFSFFINYMTPAGSPAGLNFTRAVRLVSVTRRRPISRRWDFFAS
jgi:FHS family L-fucose permease-like MFS transporter